MRKSWADLKPDYRGRLERKGITAETHATANLRMARGHDISLPHNTRERERRRERARDKARIALASIQRRERALGYLTDSDLVNAMGVIGIEGASLLVEWHEYKHEHGVKKSGGLDKEGNPLPTFREYIESNYGENVWNDVYSEYWNEAQEIEGNNFYN